MTDAVDLKWDGEQATLVLSNPDRRNALTEAMWRAVPEKIEAAREARMLIVTGAGGVFAAGADISEFEAVYATPERAEAYSRAVADAMAAIAAFPRPTLARIEGPCIGGGCGIALACDLRFAAAGARFAITPARLGLLYPLADTRRLIEAVGVSAAKELLFTGRVLGGEEALRIGLIDKLFPPNTLDGGVAVFAEQLLSASTQTAIATKTVIARIQAGQTEEDEASMAMFRAAFASDDFAEGYKAFLEKRPPQFGAAADKAD
jgi:enoyl-CoA hydratase/carnithine racemase